MEKDQLAKTLEANPQIDHTAIERSRRAVRQLADVGIKVGGYRLQPALGGTMINNAEQSVHRTED